MNSNDFDTSQKYKIKSSECTQIKCKQTSWESRKCTLSKLSRFLKVTKPILLLSSFGEFTNVLYNDKGLSSVMPVYKFSLITSLREVTQVICDTLKQIVLQIFLNIEGSWKFMY